MRRLCTSRFVRSMAVVLSINQVLLAIPLSAADQVPPSTFVAAEPQSRAASEQKTVVVNRTAPAVTPVPAMPIFSDPPTTAELTRARVFEEPLLPVGGTPSIAENRELARLITTYLTAGVPDGTDPLEVFVRQHSESPWRASLLTDLGVVWRRTGHFSKAYNAWYLAWTLSKDATDASGRAVADKALGEFVELSARLGHFDELSQLFQELKGRNIGGAAAEKVSSARQAVWMMNNEPGHSFRCGPLGLDAVLAVGKRGYTTPEPIRMCQSTKLGTSLLQMRDLAREVGASMVMAHRSPGAAVVVPALVHWNMGHFSALVDRQGDNYLLRDPTFGDESWVTQRAIDEEGSGFVLVRSQELPAGWKNIGDEEGGKVWGKGVNAGLDDKDQHCPPPGCGPGGGPGLGMAIVSLHLMLISVIVQDTPLWYAPTKGPGVAFGMRYNQREAFQPQTFSYSNLGTKWTFDWLSYVTDDPSNPAAALTVYQRGGGQESVTGFDAPTNRYAPTIREQAVVTRTATSPIRYERQAPDGSVEVFGQPDGAATYPRNIFLTEVRDSRGSALHFTYDSNLRLVAITDALGQVTTLTYTNPDPLKITGITDPFGRTATFTYDASGRLQSITDLIGLTSSFTYGAGDIIKTVTTPYGTTTITTGENGGIKRWAEVTDPLGGKERAEYGGYAVLTSEPQPTGMQTSANINHHNTQFWDKRAMAIAPGDPTSATDYIWALVQSGQWTSSAVPLGIKKPLENRVWYSYQGGGAVTEGTVRRVTGIGRVLDDGSSQVWTYAYNSRGRMTQAIDPIGRETDYVYDTTGLDLVQIKQKRSGGFDVIASKTYNNQHEPLTITDAAGQTTTLVYNAAGQILTVTNAKGETTTNSYDGNGDLLSVAGPTPGSATTYTYDAFGRVATVTDSEGYAVTSTYDAAGRTVAINYPDGTSEQTVYDRLDPQRQSDRLGRWTTLVHDQVRNLTMIRDSQGRSLTQQWCSCGSLEAIIDGNGNATSWDHDLEDRIVREIHADGTTVQYAYELTSPRLKQVTDSKSQISTYSYARDDRPLQVSYTNALITTPTVSFAYDVNYPRLSSMTDGSGVTQYAYYAVGAGQPGGGKLATVDGPLANDTITYVYDEIGRIVNRSTASVPETFAFDALGRLSAQINQLGSFGYTYTGNSPRLASVTYPNGQTTAYGYYGHGGNDRLQTIHNKFPDGSTLSKFDYSYDDIGHIATWQQQADANAPSSYGYTYDAADRLQAVTKQISSPSSTVVRRYNYGYDASGNRTTEQIDDSVVGSLVNNMNQIVSQQPSGNMLFAGSLSEQATVMVGGQVARVNVDKSFTASVPIGAGTTFVPVVASDPAGNTRTNQYQITNTGGTRSLTYDANGNLTSDGTRTFEWDARDQLVAVVAGTRRTQFSYDGWRRRVSVTVTESGNSTTKNYVWDGETPLEERDASGATTQRFFKGGTMLGSTPYFYAFDQLGSVREITDVTASLNTRLDYDPYGRPTKLQGTLDARNTYQGYFSSDSGLLLTHYRAYDPDLGRWLSRDPVRWLGGSNFYEFGDSDPINNIDPNGLQACHQTGEFPLARISVPPYNDEKPIGFWQLESASYEPSTPPQWPGGVLFSVVDCIWSRRVQHTSHWKALMLTTYLCEDCERSWVEQKISYKSYDESYIRTQRRVLQTIVPFILDAWISPDYACLYKARVPWQ